MKKITVTRTDEPAFRFTGELIADARTHGDRAFREFSGSAGRWQELKLYRTADGAWVCHRLHRTQWAGEQDQSDAAVCSTTQAVVRFFGRGALAQSLYEEAGIDDCIDLDAMPERERTT
jgi:hypothetical protein